MWLLFAGVRHTGWELQEQTTMSSQVTDSNISFLIGFCWKWLTTVKDIHKTSSVDRINCTYSLFPEKVVLVKTNSLPRSGSSCRSHPRPLGVSAGCPGPPGALLHQTDDVSRTSCHFLITLVYSCDWKWSPLNHPQSYGDISCVIQCFRAHIKLLTEYFLAGKSAVKLRDTEQSQEKTG